MKQAYLSYVSREYVVKSREIKEEIIKVILNEYEKGTELPEVCKITVLKFYAGHPYTSEMEDSLKLFLQELCERQLVFPFYLKYKEDWLREVLLHDKILIQYKAKEDGKVKLTYKAGRDVIVEPLQPVYANIYVKEFVLLEGRKSFIHILQQKEENVICEESGVCRQQRKVEKHKYGRLNAMNKMDGEELEKALFQYRLEEKMAEELFEIY